MSNDLFGNNSGPVIDPDKDYTADLVGEGKKFKDYAALARGKVESDFFINSLQAELAELRAEVQKRAGLDEVLNALKTQKEPPPVVIPPQDNPPAGAFKPEDIESLIESRLTQREAQRTKEENVQLVMSKLQEAFGPTYTDVLTGKMQELGVSKEWINNLAADNPKALLKLVSSENTSAKGNDLFTPPPASHATGFRPSFTERNQAFYDKLKKENPSVYWSKETQAARHKDAVQLGERFFV